MAIWESKVHFLFQNVYLDDLHRTRRLQFSGAFRLMLHWWRTRVFVSPCRLSKKPGDNKAKKSKQVSQKYTASRLHEKGVLISIDDLQPNQWVSPPAGHQPSPSSYQTCSCLSCCQSQLTVSRFESWPPVLSSFHLLSLRRFKNVIFEISPAEAVGVFDVKAKLMGVHLETLQIEYQVLSLSLGTTSRHVSWDVVIPHNSSVVWLLLFFPLLRICSSCSMKAWRWWRSSTGPPSMSTCLFSCSTRSFMGNRWTKRMEKETDTELKWLDPLYRVAASAAPVAHTHAHIQTHTHTTTAFLLCAYAVLFALFVCTIWVTVSAFFFFFLKHSVVWQPAGVLCRFISPSLWCS